MAFAIAAVMCSRLLHSISWALLLFCALPLPARAADVYISEVLADPPAGLAGDANGDGQRHTYEDEFVELFNAGLDSVRLDGWCLTDDDVPCERAFVFPPNTRIESGAYIVLFGGGAPKATQGPVFVDDGRIGNGLSNGDDTVLLINARGDTIDRISGNPWPQDQSLMRQTGGQLVNHTSRTTRPFSPGTSPLDIPVKKDASEMLQATRNDTYPSIYVRQILADPPSDTNGDGTHHPYEDEFLEIYNAGEALVSIAGWRLGDDDTALEHTFVFPPGTALPAGQSAFLFGGGHPNASHTTVFIDDGRIGNGLSNRGDTILLIDAKGDTVDRVDGTSWPAKSSIFRVRFNGRTDNPPETLPYWFPYSSQPATPTVDSTDVDSTTEADSTDVDSTAEADSTDVDSTAEADSTDVDSTTKADSTDVGSTTEADSAPAAQPPLPAAPAPLIDLFLSEILANPSDDANGDGQHNPNEDEFIELFNAGPTIDLSGWRLSDDDVDSTEQFTFPPGTTVGSQRYIVLFGGGRPATRPEVFADDGTIGNGLEKDDRILLISAEGDTVIDQAWRALPPHGSLVFGVAPPTAHIQLPGRGPHSPGAPRARYDSLHLVLPQLQSGQRQQLELRGFYEGAFDSVDPALAQWVSSDTSVVTIDLRGYVHALRVGTAYIEAWSGDHLLTRRPWQTLPPPNLDPLFLSQPPTHVYAGGTYTYTARAEDPEGATLIYCLVEAPSHWRLHYANGLLSGRAPLQPGQYPIYIEVVDGRGGIAHQSFMLQVMPRPAIHISEILADPPPGLAGDANGDGKRHPYADEFVELFNAGTTTIHLDGMRLGDRHSTQTIFPPHTELAPGHYMAVFGHYPLSDGRFLSAGGRIGNGLDNLNDSVYLLSPDGTDTLALATYDLPVRPQQSLVFNETGPDLHISPGVYQLFSPGAPQPHLTGLHIADPFLSMVQGEARTPTLLADWSTGIQVRIGSEARWTTSDSSVINADKQAATLHALTPGTSILTARVGAQTTPAQRVVVHPSLADILSFSPQDSVVSAHSGQTLHFSWASSAHRPLRFTWYLNGRRVAQRSKQISHRCCQQTVDTLVVDIQRGRQSHRRRWLIGAQRADKLAVPELAVHTYPNPFRECVYFAITAPQEAPLQVQIVDIRGRHVRHLHSTKPTAQAVLQWDGRDDQGLRAASGVYLYRVRQGAQVHSGKLLFIQ